MRSTLATDVPPNFITKRAMTIPGAQGSLVASGSRRRAGARIKAVPGAVNARKLGNYTAWPPHAGVIDEEVRRFDALGEEWWNPAGPMAALHRINPIRIGWMRDDDRSPISRDAGGAGEPPLAGLSLLDVGCGAGLLAEPLSRLGAEVVGLDPAEESIASRAPTPKRPARGSVIGRASVEDLVAEGARFDVVTAMEVVEHVADMPAFVAAASALVAPGGLFLALDPQPHAHAASRWRSSAPNMCLAGCRRARIAGSSSSRRPNLPPRSPPPACARRARRGMVLGSRARRLAAVAR